MSTINSGWRITELILFGISFDHTASTGRIDLFPKIQIHQKIPMPILAAARGGGVFWVPPGGWGKACVGTPAEGPSCAWGRERRSRFVNSIRTLFQRVAHFA
jgi:hypothetical protein